MTDNRAAQAASTQLGARAKTILRALADNGPVKRSARARALNDAHADTVVAKRGIGEAPAHAPAHDLVVTEPAHAGGAVPAPRPDTVVPLPQRPPSRRAPANRGEVAIAPAALRPVAARKNNRFVKLTAFLAIGLPTLFAALYYAFIASNQYVAEARFAVRGPEETGAPGDPLGAITGLSTIASVNADSFMLAQFMESRQLVDNLDRTLDLRSIFTRDHADFIARYRPYDFNDTSEHLSAFWNKVAAVYYDPVSSIITFSVRAFTPEDALKIAREAVRESEQLVNHLSERARGDAVISAKTELSRAEMRLRFARKAIRDYRDREGSVDPEKTAESKLKIVADLEGELAKQEAELTTASAFLSKDAPTVRVMRNKVSALKERIGAERAKIGTTQRIDGRISPLLSSSLAEFEELETERDFAEKAYHSAQLSVERANMRSERQARYLATFVEPRLPQDSLYPARIKMILMVFVISAIAWAIGMLIFYGIRDHTA